MVSGPFEGSVSGAEEEEEEEAEVLSEYRSLNENTFSVPMFLK